MKTIIFAGKSLDRLKNFPLEAKREAGYQLDMVQRGLDPKDYKPMTTIGLGVKEIRVKDSAGIYRVIYIAKFEEAVYVLHAFQKKTQKTSQHDLALAKTALKQILEERND